MLVDCVYTPRGRSGNALCSPLKFRGEVLRRAIKEGCWVVRIQTTAYNVSISEMSEVEYEIRN